MTSNVNRWRRIVAELRQEMEEAEEYGIEDKLFNDGVNSFGSADFWARHIYATTDENDMDVSGEYVHVRDLKTGYGEVVSEDNSQGLRYACGVMEKLGWPEGVDYIRITIDAFRFPSSSWDISREDLWTVLDRDIPSCDVS